MGAIKPFSWSGDLANLKGLVPMNWNRQLLTKRVVVYGCAGCMNVQH